MVIASLLASSDQNPLDETFNPTANGDWTKSQIVMMLRVYLGMYYV